VIGKPGTRSRALAYAIAGAVLTVACLALLTFVAKEAARADLDPRGVSKLLVMLPALGIAGGLCLVYIGLARIVAGRLVDKVDLKKVNGAGLLYVLGFVVMLGLAGYIVIGHYQIDPFTMRKIGSR